MSPEPFRPHSAPDRYPAPPLDQFNYALEGLGDMSMRFVIDFAGRLDEEQLGRACVAAIRQAPVLGCRFVEAEAPVWEALPAPGPRDLVRVTISRDPGRDLREALAYSIDPGQGPQVHLHIIRGDHDILCITVSHAAMDAHGLLALSALFALLYRDERLGDAVVPDTSDRSLAPLLAGIPARVYESLPGHQEKFTPGWKFPATGADGSQKRYAIRTLPASRLVAIKAEGRQHGATVNDILLAAFYTALRDFIHPATGTRVPILVSIDLRRYFGTGGNGTGEREGFAGGDRDPGAGSQIHTLSRAIANKSVAFQLLIPVADRKFDETIAVMMALMREQKAHYPGLASAIDTEAYGFGNYSRFRNHVQEMQRLYAETRSEPPFIGNIGVIPPEAYAFAPDLTVNNAFLAGIIIDPPGLTLGITTFEGMLTLSIGYRSPAMPEESVEGLLERIVSYLPTE